MFNLNRAHPAHAEWAAVIDEIEEDVAAETMEQVSSHPYGEERPDGGTYDAAWYAAQSDDAETMAWAYQAAEDAISAGAHDDGLCYFWADPLDSDETMANADRLPQFVQERIGDSLSAVAKARLVVLMEQAVEKHEADDD